MQHLVVLEVVQQRMRHDALVCAVMKIAVPGTRTGGASIRPGRKVSSWMPSLRISVVQQLAAAAPGAQQR